MSESFSVKDKLFNKKTLESLAHLFYIQDSRFPKTDFVNNILVDFPGLELKQRIARVTQEMKNTLPDHYPDALRLIVAALPSALDPDCSDGDFGDFIFVCYSEYIAIYGCSIEFLDISLVALKECTKRFSSEFAMRHFINRFPSETLEALSGWVNDDNYHVRRLVSESTRPRLPWGININLNHLESVAFLDVLHADTTRYVTRSVANHMNDISKIDSDFVIKKLTEWKKLKKQNDQEMQYIISHSLRTLLRKGDTRALELLGYTSDPKVEIKKFNLESNVVSLGQSLLFSGEIVSRKNQNLMIDCEIYFQVKTGLPRSKVFRIKKGSFRGGGNSFFS